MPICLRVKAYFACIPVRVVVLISVSLLYFVMEMERWLTNSALFDMTYSPEGDQTYTISECPFMMNENWPSDRLQEMGTYTYWDVNLRLALRRIFFLGHLFTQIPGGIIADLYNSRRLVIVALILFGCLALLQPFVARLGQYPFMLIRFLLGMSKGLLYASPYSILAHWAPMNERSRFVAFPVIGYAGGFLFAYMVITLAPGQWLIKLYMPGVCSLLLAWLWYHLTYSKPASCPYISESERNHISQHIKGLEQSQDPVLYPYVPWKNILSSLPFRSLLLYYVGFFWMIDTTWQQHYYYMTLVLHMTNYLTYLSILMCYFGETVSTLLWGSASDWLINNGFMSPTSNRKWFGFSGLMLVIPQLFLTLTFGCNGQAVSAVYLCLYFTRGIALGSIMANPIDLSPRFAGVIYSTVISAYSVVTLIGTIVLETTCAEMSDPSCWWRMDIIMTFVVSACTLSYLWYGSATVQPWNDCVTPSHGRVQS